MRNSVQIMSSRKLITGNKKMSNEYLSSSTFEMNIDDESNSDSMDEDSNSQLKYNSHPKSGTTDNKCSTYRRRRQIKFKDIKSHRVIEKRRRDRMNRNLDVLLDLIPHKKPDNQRRIEKTEIIEMTIKYIRNFISPNEKSLEIINLNRKSNLKLDTYNRGYHNGIYDLFDYTQKDSNNEQFLSDLICYIKEKEVQLKDLTVVPDKKGEILLSKNFPHASCDISKSRAISDIPNHENFYQFSIDEQKKSIQQTKVPIFALHPSGTHYIPMCIDSSIVIQAFNNKSKNSPSPLINEQPPCHPVSIHVNFDPISAISDPYELDIQNINVIAARHQTSVRPN